jgi:hypothetical protein
LKRAEAEAAERLLQAPYDAQGGDDGARRRRRRRDRRL